MTKNYFTFFFFFFLLQSYPSTHDVEEDTNTTEMALDVSVYFGTFRGLMKKMMDGIQDKLEQVTPIGKRIAGRLAYEKRNN